MFRFDRQKLFLGFLSLILIDQSSKFLIYDAEKHVLNKGISFGIIFLQNQSLTVLILMLIVGLAFFFWQKKYWNWGSIFFLAGAMSNFIDRIMYGGVKDWLIIPFFGLKNNLADYFIFVGLILMLAKEINFGKKHHE